MKALLALLVGVLALLPTLNALVIVSPAPAQILPHAPASFGPSPKTQPVEGELVRGVPFNGCSALTNDLTGKVALINRGHCRFAQKVRTARAHSPKLLRATFITPRCIP